MIRLTNSLLAEMIGKEPGHRNRFYWLSQDLVQLTIALKKLRLTACDQTFLLESMMPYWLQLSIIAALSSQAIAIDTPNFGQVTIPETAPEGEGKGLAFRICEDAEFTLVEFSSPRYCQPAEQLKTIMPPAVNPDKGVIISSNAPPWIIALIGIAYAKNASWVACTQKHGAAVVVISNNKAKALGTEINKQKLERVQELAALAAVPKRGEIWLFDDGYGKHPGLIISPQSRNRSDFVLLVPLTTSVKHKNWHLEATRKETGLAVDSIVLCSNISCIAKAHLLKGPISVVTDALLAEVVRHIRQAIGDVTNPRSISKRSLNASIEHMR